MSVFCALHVLQVLPPSLHQTARLHFLGPCRWTRSQWVPTIYKWHSLPYYLYSPSLSCLSARGMFTRVEGLPKIRLSDLHHVPLFPPSSARFIGVWTRESPPLGAAAFTNAFRTLLCPPPSLSLRLSPCLHCCVCMSVRVRVSFWNSRANIAPHFPPFSTCFKGCLCATLCCCHLRALQESTHTEHTHTHTHLPLLMLMLLPPCDHLLL